MERVYSELGLKFTFVDMRDVGHVERALTPATRMVYCETPTNPMMNLVDLAAVGDLAQARGLLCTWSTTPSPRRSSSARSSSARTSCSTRRPST